MSTDKSLVIQEGQPLPNLHTQAEESIIDLASSYWAPENTGESKLVFFIKIEEIEVADINNPEVMKPLLCAFFLEQFPDETTIQVHNGSKMLIGTLQENSIAPGSALKITYLGKKKNKSNSFLHDNWSIRPLQPKKS